MSVSESREDAKSCGIPKRTSPLRLKPLNSDAALASTSRSFLTCVSNTSPAGESCIPLALLTKSCRPRRCSNAAICKLTAEGDLLTICPAWTSVPVSASAAKVASDGWVKRCIARSLGHGRPRSGLSLEFISTGHRQLLAIRFPPPRIPSAI